MLKKRGRLDGATGDEAAGAWAPVHEGRRAVGLVADLLCVLDHE
jgi:hypothetical protein